MNHYKIQQQGFSLIELMIATVIGLLLSYAVMEIYVTQTRMYKTTNSQALIQSTENAIANLVTPIIRSAGFFGCGSLSTSMSNLNGGGSNPLGSLNANPALLSGYSQNGTIVITQANPNNDNNPGDWTPPLDTTLAGNVQNTSDVLVVLGATPGSFPVSITTIDAASDSFTVQQTTDLNLTAGQFAAISDCVKSSIFLVTGVSGTTISHAGGSGPYANSSSTFPVSFQPGAQFIPMQQTAFFVAQGQGGQSALMRGILTSAGWNIQALVPGVEVMKVQYGIGGNGSISQYVSANAVTNWSQVYAIRIGFLIVGQVASGNNNTTQYTVLDTQVTVPNDNRLRHVYEINIALRNSTT